MACDRKQSFLLPPDVRDWLPDSRLAWFVIDAVAVMDTAAFYAAYRADGHGRAAYEPSMMLALCCAVLLGTRRPVLAVDRVVERDEIPLDVED